MSILTAIATVSIAGAIGGVINGIMTDGGVLLPGPVLVMDELKVWRLGIFGNVLIGAVAAFLFWSIYGGGSNIVMNNPPASISMPLLTIGFSILTGVAGARWLSNEVDKYILKKSTAMAMNADASTTQHMMDASPMEILKTVAAEKK